MENKPQIVLLTFDDAVSKLHFKEYTEKILDFGNNPNGCPIGATFFLTHMYTDYEVTHEVWRRRSEIALHSFTHKTGTEYWKTMNQTWWEYEMSDLRKAISHFANIPKEDIYGMRAPFLQIGGDNMFQMLQDKGIEYDCSMPTRTPFFPYSLDYHSTQKCEVAPCPDECHPGVWAVPMNDWIDSEGNPCAMFDACPVRPKTKEEALALMRTNFKATYEGNRTPFGMFTHIAILQGNPFFWEAYQEFVTQDLLTKDDVYLITIHQLLDWMRAAVNADEAKTFKPWMTQCEPHEKNCITDDPACELVHQGEYVNMTMYMSVCGDCPKKYPWFRNPLGE